MKSNYLKDKLENFGYGSINVFKTGLKYAFGGYIIHTLISANGCLDSERTYNALRFHNPKNPIKKVVRVEEEWKDNSIEALASSVFGGAGFNPRVIRRITFEDSSKTTLDYRVLAHQPFIKWISGEEFDPQVGENYEVTSNNRFVKEINK